MKRKVLIVDGCRNTRELLTGVLENGRYEVYAVADGYEAIVQLEHHRPDLLITELTIPGMTGFDLCRITRSISTMPIVVITAPRGVEEVFRALAAGVDAFVSKPLEPGEFLAQVEGLLTVNTG